MDQKEYYKTVKRVAKQLHEEAKAEHNFSGEVTTHFYDNYVTDYEEQFLNEEDFSLLLHYEIMQFDDVVQVEVNCHDEYDVLITFKEEKPVFTVRVIDLETAKQVRYADDVTSISTSRSYGKISYVLHYATSHNGIIAESFDLQYYKIEIE